VLASEDSQKTAEMWYQRLGYPGQRKTKMFGSKAVKGALYSLQQVVNCKLYKITKSTQDLSRVLASQATQKLERAYIDFWGLYKTPTIGRSKYMLTITDDFSRKSWIYLTKDRTSVY